MNNLFLTLLGTFLGAAIGGLLTISSQKKQKAITIYLFAATGVIIVVWVGYGLGKWDNNSSLQTQKAIINVLFFTVVGVITGVSVVYGWIKLDTRRNKLSDISSKNLQDGSEAAQKPVVTRTDPDEDMGSEDNLKKISKQAKAIDKLIEVSRDLNQETLEKEKDPEKKKRMEIYKNFFSDHNNSVLGEEIGKAALKKYRDQDKFLEEIPDINSIQEDRFCIDISQYLRLIRTSLLTQDYTNLRVPGAVVRHSLSFPEVYQESLKILKTRLTDDIKYQAREEIEDTIDFLIDKFSNNKS
ncbi:MAG: hypothetical protein F6K63_29330 [Moorea sp. SIO1G6]|uniref:hypothetical protein n=1 Tax=Moorena sp. SIO1G6 TaxID=2607840 RepID=UPI0013C0785A|nr:hypothetical protein [Moorena sp. SIO1G6]NET68276.1 hypothetical protein [Moorena sp. SIO1G6]